jgi:hypothetical protein
MVFELPAAAQTFHYFWLVATVSYSGYEAL